MTRSRLAPALRPKTALPLSILLAAGCAAEIGPPPAPAERSDCAGDGTCVDPPPPGDPPPRPVVRAHAAATSDELDLIATELRAGEAVEHVTRRSLPATGRTLLQAKVFDAASRSTREVVFDVDTGEPVDLLDLATAERLRRAARAVSHSAVPPAELDPSAAQLLVVPGANDIYQRDVQRYAYQGTTVTAAVVEPGACIDRSHPVFEYVAFQPRYSIPDCNIHGNGGHSTRVASVLAGAYATAKGAWHNGQVGTYDGRIFDSVNTNLAALFGNRNPDLVNLSYEVPESQVDEIDDAVYRQRIFVANASGNNPTQPAICPSYNSLCVGGYRHRETASYWDDEPGGTSYLNGPSGREEPKLVGPVLARGVAAAGGGYTDATGSSVATPYVVGLAGLLMRSFPGQLRRQPALTRAVLMASAVRHPIPYDSNGNYRPYVRFDDGYDDQSGAGAPQGALAVSIVNRRQFVADDQFTQSDLGLIATVDVPASNMHVRAVLTWDNCPNDANELVADLDLTLDGDRLSQPRTNHSSVDNYEIIDAVLPAGTYELHVSAARWGNCALDGSTRRVPMALAWTTTQVHLPEVRIEARGNTGKCVHKDEANWNNGNPVHLWTCSSGSESFKRWVYDPTTKRIHAADNPNKCWHKKQSGWNDGNPIHLWDCWAGSDEMKTWLYSAHTGRIHAAGNVDMCIHRANANWNNGNPLQLSRCTRGASYEKSWNLDAQ